MSICAQNVFGGFDSLNGEQYQRNLPKIYQIYSYWVPYPTAALIKVKFCMKVQSPKFDSFTLNVTLIDSTSYPRRVRNQKIDHILKLVGPVPMLLHWLEIFDVWYARCPPWSGWCNVQPLWDWQL